MPQINKERKREKAKKEKFKKYKNRVKVSKFKVNLDTSKKEITRLKCDEFKPLPKFIAPSRRSQFVCSVLTKAKPARSVFKAKIRSKQKLVQTLLITQSKIRHFHSSFKSKNLPSFQSKNSLKAKARPVFAQLSKQNSLITPSANSSFAPSFQSKLSFIA